MSKFGLAIGVVLLSACKVLGADADLFHVRQNTYACKNPDIVVYAATAAAAGHAADRQVRSVIAEGQCAPITPKSPWRVLSSRGDLSFMAYAGTTAAQGSYYFRTSEMFDADGHTPAEVEAAAAAAPAAPTPVTAPAPGNAIQTDPEPAPATVDAPQRPATPTPATEAPSPSSVGDDTAPAAPPAVAPAVQELPMLADTSNEGLTASGWGVLILIALAIAGFLAIVVRGRRRQAELRRQTVAAANAEIGAKAQTLGIRRMQLTPEDHYGTRHYDKWFKEIQMFLATRIQPIFQSAGLGDLYTLMQPQLVQEVDAAAVQNEPSNVAPVFVSTPSVFNEAMDPVHYEVFCAILLRAAGWVTHMTPVTGDQGADIVAEKDGHKLVVQCKRYSSPVGNSAVQEAFTAKNFQRAQIAAVVSNAGFTPSARTLASATGVRLLHHSELASFAA